MVISKKTSLVTFGAFALFLVFVGWLEDERQPRAPETVEKVAVRPTPPVAQPSVKPFMIYLSDMKMQRSKAFRIDGDLRPVWRLSGRIRNNSDEEIKSVTIRIYINPKSSTQVIDEATLPIDIDISSDGVGSFSREVQMMPPDSEWHWTYEVIKADPK